MQIIGLLKNMVLTSKNGYILNKPSVPGVLVECGFLSNPQERNRLNEESYQKTLAKAILEGLLIYEKENK